MKVRHSAAADRINFIAHRKIACTGMDSYSLKDYAWLVAVCVFVAVFIFAIGLHACLGNRTVENRNTATFNENLGAKTPKKDERTKRKLKKKSGDRSKPFTAASTGIETPVHRRESAVISQSTEDDGGSVTDATRLVQQQSQSDAEAGDTSVKQVDADCPQNGSSGNTAQGYSDFRNTYTFAEYLGGQDGIMLFLICLLQVCSCSR